MLNGGVRIIHWFLSQCLNVLTKTLEPICSESKETKRKFSLYTSRTGWVWDESHATSTVTGKCTRISKLPPCPPKGGLNKSRLTLRANAVPQTSPISEEGNPIAQIGFVEANQIRAILDEKWQQEKACGERGPHGGRTKRYTIKMHLTIEWSPAVIVWFDYFCLGFWKAI